MGRRNTTIDHVYSDQILNIGSIAVIKPKDEMANAGQELRKKI